MVLQNCGMLLRDVVVQIVKLCTAKLWDVVVKLWDVKLARVYTTRHGTSLYLVPLHMATAKGP